MGVSIDQHHQQTHECQQSIEPSRHLLDPDSVCKGAASNESILEEPLMLPPLLLLLPVPIPAIRAASKRESATNTQEITHS